MLKSEIIDTLTEMRNEFIEQYKDHSAPLTYRDDSGRKAQALLEAIKYIIEENYLHE